MEFETIPFFPIYQHQYNIIMNQAFFELYGDNLIELVKATQEELKKTIDDEQDKIFTRRGQLKNFQLVTEDGVERIQNRKMNIDDIYTFITDLRHCIENIIKTETYTFSKYWPTFDSSGNIRRLNKLKLLLSHEQLAHRTEILFNKIPMEYNRRYWEKLLEITQSAFRKRQSIIEKAPTENKYIYFSDSFAKDEFNKFKIDEIKNKISSQEYIVETLDIGNPFPMILTNLSFSNKKFESFENLMWANDLDNFAEHFNNPPLAQEEEYLTLTRETDKIINNGLDNEEYSSNLDFYRQERKLLSFIQNLQKEGETILKNLNLKQLTESMKEIESIRLDFIEKQKNYQKQLRQFESNNNTLLLIHEKILPNIQRIKSIEHNNLNLQTKINQGRINSYITSSMLNDFKVNFEDIKNLPQSLSFTDTNCSEIIKSYYAKINNLYNNQKQKIEELFKTIESEIINFNCQLKLEQEKMITNRIIATSVLLIILKPTSKNKTSASDSGETLSKSTFNKDLNAISYIEVKVGTYSQFLEFLEKQLEVIKKINTIPNDQIAISFSSLNIFCHNLDKAQNPIKDFLTSSQENHYKFRRNHYDAFCDEINQLTQVFFDDVVNKKGGQIKACKIEPYLNDIFIKTENKIGYTVNELKRSMQKGKFLTTEEITVLESLTEAAEKFCYYFSDDKINSNNKDRALENINDDRKTKQRIQALCPTLLANSYEQFEKLRNKINDAYLLLINIYFHKSKKGFFHYNKSIELAVQAAYRWRYTAIVNAIKELQKISNTKLCYKNKEEKTLFRKTIKELHSMINQLAEKKPILENPNFSNLKEYQSVLLQFDNNVLIFCEDKLNECYHLKISQWRHLYERILYFLKRLFSFGFFSHQSCREKAQDTLNRLQSPFRNSLFFLGSVPKVSVGAKNRVIEIKSTKF